MNAEVRKYMAEIGAKGGKAGKGKADRKAICRKAAEARWAKYRAARTVAKKKKQEEASRLEI